MKARWNLTAMCVGLATLVAFSVAQADHGEERLVGTWRVTIHGFDAFAHMVFHEENTLTERNTLSRGLTMSSGVWKKLRGRGRFATTMEGFIDEDLDGTFDFRGFVRQTIHVEGDTLTGTGTVDVYTLDGETYLFTLAGGGSGFEGTRMRVIRE